MFQQVSGAFVNTYIGPLISGNENYYWNFDRI